MKKQQAGFTLIELVAVIVLLGILAVTALPRFVDLQEDARIAVLDGTRGALQGAMAQTYAASLIAGTAAAADQVVVAQGQNIAVDFGYPEATQAAIDAAVNLDADDIVLEEVAGVAPAGDEVHIGYDINADGDISAGNCYLIYTAAVDANNPATIAVGGTGGC